MTSSVVAGGISCPPATPALSVREVTKVFGVMKALDRASVDVYPGEIVGLLGSNGSGKSTLIKILAGFHQADGGEVRVDGEPIVLAAGLEARDHGLRFVHQDLGLISSLTVLENLLIGSISTDRSLTIAWRSERRRARGLFEQYRLQVDPDALVEELPPIKRAMLAIVRAVADFPSAAVDDQGAPGDRVTRGHGVLVLDEPTVFLSGPERALLFDLVRRLSADGVGVLFVSHDLEEIRELCDRVVVLRDGQVCGNACLEDVDDEAIVRLIVGREVAQFAKEPRNGSGVARGLSVEVRGLSGPGVVDIDLTIGEGEILGVTGLSGSGFEAVPYLLYGALPADAGHLVIDGVEHDLSAFSPDAAIDAGMVLVPADRPADAVVADLTLADNISLPVLSKFVSGGRLRNRDMKQACLELLRRFRVKPADPQALMGALSGGNQQRAVLAKWLHLDPRMMLLDEPTQGVDVGARQDILRMLRAAADSGVAIVCASSDHDQLAVLCDRVIVFRNGRPRRELVGDDLTKHHISEAGLRA
ncbi:Ribose import ATP-binding protein RbsA [Capillimicrobium parvum]|uniref:Ribose import ATP-binding protein RbsA n=2 Tax=Capillimicrobium parvum TaxID=2884022 RepID=A0A9E7BYU5_9ACTN|nr:Ribose import ATP-binding protein RbsA [Capillimicrobium parvum]